MARRSTARKPVERVALVTGKLAEPGMRRIARDLAAAGRIDPHVLPLNIQVAALMTAQWVARKLALPPGETFDRVVLPGYCRGDPSLVQAGLNGTPVDGPHDMRDLPEHFGRPKSLDVSPKASAVEDAKLRAGLQIIAEINDAARLPMDTLLAAAESFRGDGCDIIDVGCDPQSDRPAWEGVREAVRQLRKAGHRVSVDSFHPREVELACAAGAELVLSVNSTNCRLAKKWKARVVAIPDEPRTLAGLDQTVATLRRQRVSFMIDPIIEPIGFGFAASLGRYLQVRKRYPKAQMMMGVGNLTEMTEVDSAGVNALLAGFCVEQNIRCVLTTQVINWARSSVRELAAARQMIGRAVTAGRPPKHLDSRLVMLRDPRLRRFDPAELDRLAQSLTDRNVRVFAQDGRLHAMNKDFHLVGDDPFELFDRMNLIDASHAFYLGYEMAKAVTALTLGKNYTQDQPLSWGMLTRPEVSVHERRKAAKKP